MKKISKFIYFIFLIILISLTIILSTIVLKQKDFNNLINEKINRSNYNIK